MILSALSELQIPSSKKSGIRHSLSLRKIFREWPVVDTPSLKVRDLP